ncbi:metallophosphoesterase family protein [Lunatibacter salilacus]|uniref:metallophosphoesterase family protein n=1 Tax=Lunatibacter salilacus TaxID=2483804 RepID=UPI00131B3E44|nr:metallophosphoesterase [Lunatibacter salilacus]
MRFYAFIMILASAIQSFWSQSSARDSTSTFVFLTDVHLKPEMNAPIGFQLAIDKINELNPDFILSGGDQVYDVMRGNQERADSLFTLYTEMSKGFDMKVYNRMGNHDLFGIYEESPKDETHPDYKYGMYIDHGWEEKRTQMGW